MAKSAKQRQAEYRARRKEQGLCAWPGCDRKPRKYALCPDHREASREIAQNRTDFASMYPEMKDERDTLRSCMEAMNREILRVGAIAEETAHFRGGVVYEVPSRVAVLVSYTQRLEHRLAQANRRKAGYLAEGVVGSERLEAGKWVQVGPVA